MAVMRLPFLLPLSTCLVYLLLSSSSPWYTVTMTLVEVEGGMGVSLHGNTEEVRRRVGVGVSPPPRCDALRDPGPSLPWTYYGSYPGRYQ
jgi:hypothetical protein